MCLNLSTICVLKPTAGEASGTDWPWRRGALQPLCWAVLSVKMPKSHHKAAAKPDFKRRKFKVGRKAPQRANLTDASFQVGATGAACVQPRALLTVHGHCPLCTRSPRRCQFQCKRLLQSTLMTQGSPTRCWRRPFTR